MSSEQSIALCMIVRDESDVIERCLDSVHGLIDTWVICDTGSTDETVDLMGSKLAGVPGFLHRTEWVDFAHNRTELMERAAGSADYLLLLDADMTIEASETLPRLTADAYLIRHAGQLAYRIPRLVRADRSWRFVGSTHEYLATADGGPHFEQPLDAWVVVHHADGGSRNQKFSRDRRLLERELDLDPENARATFYLAQTLADLGERERAIAMYERRVELGGWDEERFYAAFRAGALLSDSDDDRAFAALLRACELSPTRSEALHALAVLCRRRQLWESALAFAARGLALPCPEDGLFLHLDVYEHGIALEYALAAYWTGRFTGSLAACEELLSDPTLAESAKSSALETRDFCLRQLALPRARRLTGRRSGEPPGLASLAPSLALAELRLDAQPDWPQFNPTIAADGGGFRLIVRTSNYRVREDGSYLSLDGDGVIRTVNHMVWLDGELQVSDFVAIEDGSLGPERWPSPVEGYEDCRLVQVGDHWYATATVRDRNPASRCEMALLSFDGADIDEVRVLKPPGSVRDEKNWIPFALGGELALLYSMEPAVTLRCDPLTGELSGSGLPWDLPPLTTRGGAGGLPVPGGRLFVVHEVDHEREPRRYLHRLVLLDEELSVSAASDAFVFLGEEIEFCAGMAMHGDHLLLSFGVGDRAAMLARVSLDDALGLLETELLDDVAAPSSTVHA